MTRVEAVAFIIILVYIPSVQGALNLITEDKYIRQGVAYKGIIKPYETQMIKFTEGGGLKRIFYFQCTGSADLSIYENNKGKEVQYFRDFISKVSDSCDDTYACYRDPCSEAGCPSYPEAECIGNYCGGCTADWYLEDRKVDCLKGTNMNSFIKGAPAHKAVLQFTDSNYTFNLLGKRSGIDNLNSYLLYVFDNYKVDNSIIMMGEEAEVVVASTGQTVKLEWMPPIYGLSEDILQHYCIYRLEKPYIKYDKESKNLAGDWVACGHLVKEPHQPFACTNDTSFEFNDLARGTSHYFWVVAISVTDTPTSYPFVRVDIKQEPFSRTLILSYSVFLLVMSVFLVGE